MRRDADSCGTGPGFCAGPRPRRAGHGVTRRFILGEATMSTRRLLPLALALVITGASACDAMAYTVTPINGGQTLAFQAASGEDNTLTVSLAGGNYIFTDTTAPVTAAVPPCTQ